MWSPDNQTLALRGGGPINTWGVYLYSLATRERIGAALTVNGHTFVGPLGAGGQIYERNKTYPLGFSSDGSAFEFLAGDKKERVSLNLETNRERVISTAADRAW